MTSVAEAFRTTPREGFLPERARGDARMDRPLPIGRGATNSQPSTVRDMLELLQVPPGSRVLDVGSGSGWTTALLAHLTGPEGRVFGVELEPELVAFGARNLAAMGRDWAGIQQALPGIFGLPDEGPFDRILVSAMADELPQELVEQLRPDGVMVIPVDGRMMRVWRKGEAVIHETHGHYVFVPLRH